MDILINRLAFITLFEMMITIGLSVSAVELLTVVREPRVLLRAAVANYLVVPFISVLLLLAFGAQPLVAAGFLIAAVCPGAPYGPPFTAMAKGNVVLSIGLMVMLAASSAVLAPLLLQVLIPLVTKEEGLKVSAAGIVATLAVGQLLPLCAGLLVRHRRPALAQRLLTPFTALSKVLNLLLIGLIMAVQFRTLIEIQPRAWAGMSLLVTAIVICGWALGGSERSNRRSMAMTTSVRNVGVSLVIASGSFPGTPAVTAATAYGLFQTVVLAVLALIWGRLAEVRRVVGTAEVNSGIQCGRR